MTHAIQSFLFLIIFITVLSIERALGLPFISLVITSSYLAPLAKGEKTLGMIVTGLLISISYLIPIWLGIMLVALLVFVLEQRLIFFQRETLTYFSVVLFTAVVLAFTSHFTFTFANMLYHFSLAIFCLFLIRYWFIKRTNKWKMYS